MTMEGRRCQKRGCRSTTTGGKPYCSDHLTELPYIARLREMLEEAEEEGSDEALEPVNVGGTIAQDLRRLLTTGPKTVDLLANRLRLAPGVVLRHVKAMEQAGLVRRERHGWRTEVVTLMP